MDTIRLNPWAFTAIMIGAMLWGILLAYAVPL